MEKVKTLPWDVIDHWETDEDILSYLKVVLEDPDPDLIALTLVDIARAKGVLNELEVRLRKGKEAAVSGQ
ncbi:MAG: hypothetical protein F4X89_06935 [Dehalococcoidia bacterium]|nr:hypothetical protein [Dehalococcoidia bacterium]